LFLEILRLKSGIFLNRSFTGTSTLIELKKLIIPKNSIKIIKSKISFNF
jgi:hypothetical protein